MEKLQDKENDDLVVDIDDFRIENKRHLSVIPEIDIEELPNIDIYGKDDDDFENIEHKTKKKSFKKFHGFFFATLSAFFLSLSNTFIRKASLLNGSEQAAIRYLLQLIVMLSIIFYKKLSPFGQTQDRIALILRGVFGMLALVCLHFSIKFIDPSDSVALLHTNVIIIAFFARIFLGEKLNIAHFISVFLTIFGIFLISQPFFIKSIIYPKNPINNINTTTSDDEISKSSSKFYNLIGICFGLAAAFFSSMVPILLKKLSNKKVHFSVAIIYASYFGLPFSLVISTVIFFTGVENKNINQYEGKISILLQILFSFISASSGVLSQILMNISLKYEQASKISILRSTDLFFTFILQHFFLSIDSNLFSIIGAILIFISAVLVLIFKIIDQTKTMKETKKNNPCLRKLLFKI